LPAAYEIWLQIRANLLPFITRETLKATQLARSALGQLNRNSINIAFVNAAEAAMRHALQTILAPHNSLEGNKDSARAALFTRGGRITSYFAQRVIALSVSLGLLVTGFAIALVSTFPPGQRGSLSAIGVGLITWSTATIAFVVTVGAAIYGYAVVRGRLRHAGKRHHR
jgi:hypothetical protein